MKSPVVAFMKRIWGDEQILILFCVSHVTW
jgi:hypothetical protein